MNETGGWQQINRIAFTGDILRPFMLCSNQWVSATTKNIRWLHHLIGWQLEKATGLPQTRVSWEALGFNGEAFYALSNLPINYNTWASLFYQKSINAVAEEKIVEQFANALVIGVEIPDLMQAILIRHRIPFIDIVSHPVRFMEDMLFGFRTNDVAVHHALQRFQINLNDFCKPRANLILAKTTWMPTLSLPENTALITGQVATDKALICRKQGRFLNLGDFTENLFAICEKHPLVLYKPHPYQDANCPSKKIIESLKSIKMIQHNYYYLIAQDGISDVYAITSGTVGEAPYFNKKSHLFGEPLYDFDDHPPTKDEAGACIAISGNFLAPHFWADVLKSIVETNENLPAGPTLRPSLLRRSLNADWDYSYIDEVVQRDRKGTVTV